MNSSTNVKPYSKPELVELGSAIESTLGYRGYRRDYRYGRRRRW